MLLRSFLKTLDRAERHVLMLFYAEELNTTEIALVLDMPEPAVQETLEDIQSRARSALGATVHGASTWTVR